MPRLPDLFGFRKRRRTKLREKTFPQQWSAILDRNIPYLRRLTPADRRTLEGLIQIFLNEKRFFGVNDLEITDEIRVTIAAQACILLLHRPGGRPEDGRTLGLYPTLRSIHVYPSAFVTRARASDGLLVSESEHVTLGQSWHKGPVVVSWTNVLAGAASATDGENVVFHEFAHQLDAEDGDTNGAPRLEQGSMYAAWSKTFSSEYEDLQRDLYNRHNNILGAYAATNPAEFFAVATERFFERPEDLKQQSPELFEQLKLFYGQDPSLRLSQHS